AARSDRQLLREVSRITTQFTDTVIATYRELFAEAAAPNVRFDLVPAFTFAFLQGLALDRIAIADDQRVSELIAVLKDLAADVLGGSAWYRAQPLAVRARLGLHLVAHFMKIGLQFEGVLKRGLLAFAASLPNRSPEFRYVYHEIIEEAQHALMFQEFVNRSGFDLRGLTGVHRFLAGRLPR